jgi:hypothetical protein
MFVYGMAFFWANRQALFLDDVNELYLFQLRGVFFHATVVDKVEMLNAAFHTFSMAFGLHSAGYLIFCDQYNL